MEPDSAQFKDFTSTTMYTKLAKGTERTDQYPWHRMGVIGPNVPTAETKLGLALKRDPYDPAVHDPVTRIPKPMKKWP